MHNFLNYKYNYYPFGSVTPGRSFISGSYRYAFNGKEKDDEIVGSGNAYNFENRIYDPRLGRWLSIDPLSSKYPDLSPYNFCSNSPIIFKDFNGKDFGVEINKSETGNTIIIKQNIYTVNQKAYDQASAAANEINAITKLVKIDGVEYTLRFEVKVIEPNSDGAPSSNPNDVKNQQFKNAMTSSKNDPVGNLYKGTRGVSEEENDSYNGTVKVVGGQTKDGKDISMNTMIFKDKNGFEDRVDGGNITSLVAHEFLHTMGLDDEGGTYYTAGGRMEYVGNKSNNFKMNDISNSDISQILNYAKINDGVAPATEAKVNVTGNGKDDLKNANAIEVTNKN